MELQKFTEKTVAALSQYYGEGIEIKTHKVYKNNGILLQGVCVMKPDKNIAPTIYLNGFMERYQKGETYGSLIKEMVYIIERNQPEHNFDVNFFMNYEEVKKKLVIRLVDAETNKELLNKVPYLEFQDLAIVCSCLVMTEDIGMGTILIYKEHLKHWNVDEKTLLQDAIENAARIEPYQILKMSELVKDIMWESLQEQIEEICGEYVCDKEALMKSTLENMAKELEEKQIPMYVLTNQKRCYGASCLVYPGMLEILAEKIQDDFYIIPSSVHETIIIAQEGCMDSASLNEMIEEVNLTQVDKEERLSDHTYLYVRKSKKLISVTNRE